MKTRAFNRVITGILLILFSIPALAQQLSDPIPVSPDVRIGKLANGLTYYIRKNSRPEQKVELRLVVNAGSILEDDDQQGLAHFTEHMGFNGSRNFKKNELVSFLQDMGVKFGADLNAYTSFDETVYILPVPVQKKENFEKGMLVLEDWAAGVSFDDQEIDKERGVVLEESRLGKGAEDRINKVLFPKVFEGSKYATRLPIGKDDILKSFKHDVIRRFYKDWYRPDLMAVVVVGDIDPAEAERLIKLHFEKLKNPSNEKARVVSDIPVRQKTEAAIVTDKEATNTILEIQYPIVHAKVEKTLGDYRESIIRNLFQNMLRLRLQELTQTANPPFIFGSSNIGGFVRGFEAYSSFAVIGQAGVETALTALIQEDERARKFGFTAPELDRAKKNTMKAIERAYNERDKTESEPLADELIRNFLAKEPIPGIEKEYAFHQQYLDGITLAEVNAYAAKTIPAGGSKLVMLTGPSQSDVAMPTSDQLLGFIDKAAHSNVTAYAESAVATSLLATAPAAGKVTSVRVNKEASFTDITLSNGVRVLLKPTDFKNDQVVMSGFRYGGQYLFGTPDRYNAEFATQIVSAMGVGQFSPTDLRKVLAGKQVSVTTRLGALSEGMGGQCSASDVETMLQLTYLYFTQPRKDDELFKSFVNRQRDLYQNQMSDPEVVFQDSVLEITYKHHPRAPKVPRAETFASINEDRVLQIYRERFGDANGFTFVIVGAFAIDKITPMIEQYLGSLPTGGQVSTFKDAGVRPVTGVVKKEVKRGTEQKSFISMRFSGEATWAEDEQLKLQALIEVMNIKLIESLREELSGMYGGGMNGTLNKNPYNNYSITVSIPCGPENVDKLIAATLEEINKVKANGPLQSDLNKVKENWKKKYAENLRDNSYWMRQLQSSVEMGTDPAGFLSYEKKVDALTVADLKTVANKYFGMKNYIQIVLNPEK